MNLHPNYGLEHNLFLKDHFLEPKWTEAEGSWDNNDYIKRVDKIDDSHYIIKRALRGVYK